MNGRQASYFFLLVKERKTRIVAHFHTRENNVALRSDEGNINAVIRADGWIIIFVFLSPREGTRDGDCG